jgi:hypothetical protein
MNCRVCNQPTAHLLTLEDMPGQAVHLSANPQESKTTLDLCQCKGCGLVQLKNDPVWYWQTVYRTIVPEQEARLNSLREMYDFVSHMELEHQPEPNKYLAGLDGNGVIEVPNFSMILERALFAEIMLDHLTYFTYDTLEFTLNYNGWEVLNIHPVWDNFILQAVIRRREPLGMYPFVEQMVYLKAQLDKWISKYQRVAIYGASHQAFAYLALLKPKVAFIVDDNADKQGKYAPVGGLKIYEPTKLKYDPPNAVIIMGGSYSDIIARKLDFDGGVAIIRDWGVEVVR